MTSALGPSPGPGKRSVPVHRLQPSSWPGSVRWTRRSWLRILAGAVTSYVAAHLAAARIIGRPALTALALAHGHDTAFWPAVPGPALAPTVPAKTEVEEHNASSGSTAVRRRASP